MKKHVFAAFAAALIVAGVAGANYFQIVETKQVKATHSIIVGKNAPASGLSEGDIQVQGSLSVAGTTTQTGTLTASAGLLGPVPTTQVIASAGTIAADACGGIKRISSASAVTTNTTDTFTAPSAANAGCIMQVCNVNASDAITLDDNAKANLSGIGGATPGNTVLGALDCVSVGSDGSVWSQLAPGSQN